MSVKTIFKVLIGTVAIMIISFAVIEYFNVSVTSPMIKSLAQTCLRQSCQYFAQESYKDGKGNAEQLTGVSILDGTGDEIIKSQIQPSSLNGIFYVGSSETIYNKLYTSSDFKKFCSNFSGKWKELDRIAYGLGVTGGNTLNQSDKEMAKYYVNDLVTPLNMGVAYLDKATIEKIFRWQFTAVLRNDQPDLLYDDYVKYKGFRIYYNDIKVKNINYRVYDLLGSNDDKKDFQELTNIDVDNYIKGYGVSGAEIKSDDERRYVCVATLDYSINVGYEGITPIKHFMEYLWNLNVGGYDELISDNPNTPPSSTAGKQYEADQNKAGQAITNRDVEGLQVDNVITYYIIR